MGKNKSMTHAELTAWRELARAAKKLRQAQCRAAKKVKPPRNQKGVANG